MASILHTFLRVLILYYELKAFCSMTAPEDLTGTGRSCDVRSAIDDAKYPFCRRSKETSGRLVCFGGIDDGPELREENVRTLVICFWPWESFDPDAVLRRFPSTRKLVVASSNITRLTSAFPSSNELLERVELTGTRLRELPRFAFSSLRNLRVLDLRNNSLGHVDPTAVNATSLRRLYLAGNPLECTNALRWILDPRGDDLSWTIVDREKLRCSSPYEGKSLLAILQLMAALAEECEKTLCECELVYVMIDRRSEENRLMAFNSLNCSARGLTTMPAFLPANTTTLRLARNKIRDLTPLLANPSYERVMDVYLDDNEIESILELDGSYWLDHFRLFSLRGNRLKDLPTYALENALVRSDTAVTLNLGNNPWRCDCHFTPGFQDLLVRYASLVKDIDDVKCGYVAGDENSGKQIRELTRTEICRTSNDDVWIHPLDILNVLLASLILLVLGKLLYDYWSFKRTGKLPWIVTKIP